MHAVMFFFLFKDFYKQAYTRKLKVTSNGHVKNGYVKEENGHSSSQNGYPNQNGYSSKNGLAHNGTTCQNGSNFAEVRKYYVDGVKVD